MFNHSKIRKEDYKLLFIAFLITSLGFAGFNAVLNKSASDKREGNFLVLNTAEAATQSTSTPTLSATVAVSLTFSVDSTAAFGTVTAGGGAVFATSTLNANTNNSSGWFVNLYGNNQGTLAASTTMYLSGDYNTSITDQAEWVPGAATTTAGTNAVQISSLDNSQNVLAFRVMTASSSNGTAFTASTWWGTADDYSSNANTKWAGIASSTVYRTIGNAGSGSYSASDHLNTVLYYLKVASTQQGGTYTGPLTYSATVNP